jgi:phage terminase large subunit
VESLSEKKFKYTQRQKEAAALLANPKTRYVLLYGGARSAKTFFAIRYILLRALKYPKTLHLIARATNVAVYGAIFLTLLPEVIKLCFNDISNRKGVITYYKSSPRHIEFCNRSIIFFAGIDDQKATDKILGYEFTTFLLDEVSEIHYETYRKVRTRLAQKNEAKKTGILTMNPTTTRHWAYRIFIDKIEPQRKELLDSPDRYASLLMNPADNIENLPKEFLDELNDLPEQDKERFLFGRFSDNVVGSIYSAQLQRAMNENRISNDVVADKEHYVYAVFDLGIGDLMAWWVCQFLKDKVIFLDYDAKPNLTIIEAVQEIIKKGHKITGVYLPHDAANRNVQTGITVTKLLTQFSSQLPDSLRFWVLQLKKASCYAGIQNARTRFRYCHFKMPECQAGIDALKAYHYQIDESMGETSQEPVDDWSSHGADAFRYVLTAYQYIYPPAKEEEPRDPNKIYVKDLFKRNNYD